MMLTAQRRRATSELLRRKHDVALQGVSNVKLATVWLCLVG